MRFIATAIEPKKKSRSQSVMIGDFDALEKVYCKGGLRKPGI